MSTYTKITDFAAKDALLTGNPSKIVKGTEIGAEFDSIASADASNVKGPTSAVTDNAVVRWDTTTGRIAQGSSVTIDDTGNIAGTSFTGALNGTVGATTPSTGAFTTLSASGTVTGTAIPFAFVASGSAGANHLFQATNGTQDVRLGIDGSNNCYVGTVSAHDLLLERNGATVATVSSTGLAVTGALSSSGNVSMTATNPALLFNTSNFQVYKLSNDIRVYTEGVDRATFNATGLAVTGALSATAATPTLTLTATATNNPVITLADPSGRTAIFSGPTSPGIDYARVGTTTSHNLSLITANTVQATLDTSGNLGLGVTPSAISNHTEFDIGQSGSNFTSLSQKNGFDYAAVLGWNSYGGSSVTGTGNGYKYKNSSQPASMYAQTLGIHSWFTAPSGTAGNAITFTQAMTLDASGNHIVGDTVTGVTNSNSYNFRKGTGDLSVNHITGTVSGISYENFGYGGGVIGSITQNGTTAVAYNTTSDHRLKLNVRDANAARFMDIQFRDFEWVDGRHDCGVIAHELQAVYPDLVMGEKDATEVRTVEITPAVPEVKDEEGNVVTPAVPAVTEQQTFPVYQQVNYIGLICRMGTRIQQQQRLIDAQAAALAAIEARLAAAGL